MTGHFRRGRGFIGLLLAAMTSACGTRGEDFPTWYQGAARIVAIGDLHGDLDATRRALHLAGATDADDRWIGGRLVVVQTGDILDRGDEEIEIMDLFLRLKEEARAGGGAVHVLNGNHELMNVYQDFRYVTEDGFADFRDIPLPSVPDSALLALEPTQRGRAVAFRPGGIFARRLAKRNTAVVVGGTLFVHGGILPANVEMGLRELNAEVRSWLLGEISQPEWIRGDDSPVWTRLYSDEPTPEGCQILSEVLDELGVERMVMGHTVQDGGITPLCGGLAWGIDAGLAAHYGGPMEILEIRDDEVRVLREK